LSLFTIIHPFS